MSRWRASPLAPWAGLFLGAGAWFAHHQLGSDSNFWSCAGAGGAFVVATGLACAAVAAGGGLVSWASASAGASQNRGFARIVGMTAAAIFLLAIGFQTLAGVLVPACHR